VAIWPILASLCQPHFLQEVALDSRSIEAARLSQRRRDMVKSTESHPSQRRKSSRKSTNDLHHLDDIALLELLLGRGAKGEGKQRATELMGFGGSLDGLARLSPSLLAQHPGLGLVRATRLAAAFELGARRFRTPISRRRIDSLEAVVDWARSKLLGLDHEEMWVLSLDGRNALLASRRTGQGGLHGIALTAKDILRPALRDGASSIVLVHNHPSGDPTPSPEDIRMTRSVVLACNAIGLPLLDHVVVAREGQASLLSLGVVPAR
jgi:DNA repair protein RadC